MLFLIVSFLWRYIYLYTNTCGNDEGEEPLAQSKVEELPEGHLGLKEDVPSGHQRLHRALGLGLQSKELLWTCDRQSSWASEY